ncbi:MAG: CBS domain-containing protein [Longimicrobiales bacterium]|nr:CBS domain-containing protein [Longimicrobiales bacterium]
MDTASLTLADWLDPERIEVLLAVDTLEGALRALLAHTPEGVLPGAEARTRCAHDLAAGARGEVVRIGDDAVVVVSEEGGVKAPTLFLGVSVDPFAVTAEGGENAGHARAVVLALTPARPEALRARLVPALRRFLSTDEGRLALYAARSADEVLEMTGFMTLPLPGRIRVLGVMEPVSYRVYPDTPATEVFHLMTRRGLRAVPVVGEEYEVLGIITAGDALRHLVPRTQRGKDVAQAIDRDLARDVMARSVLCVSEDQAIGDVAALMVKRDVEILPVVREGEFVGFVTREAVLRSILGDTGDTPSDDAEIA